MFLYQWRIPNITIKNCWEKIIVLVMVVINSISAFWNDPLNWKKRKDQMERRGEERRLRRSYYGCRLGFKINLLGLILVSLCIACWKIHDEFSKQWTLVPCKICVCSDETGTNTERHNYTHLWIYNFPCANCYISSHLRLHNCVVWKHGLY